MVRPAGTPFGRLLERLWSARGLCQHSFAQALGISPGVVQFIRVGRRRPPLHDLERWAEVLALAGQEREVFLLIGRLEHAPAEVRTWIRALQADREALVTRHGSGAARRSVPVVAEEFLREEMPVTTLGAPGSHPATPRSGQDRSAKGNRPRA